MTNADARVIDGFGDEWARFDQSALSTADSAQIFDDYFHIFPWDDLPDGAVGIDVGCGSGRWARMVAPRVGHLHAVDPAIVALRSAQSNLRDATNVTTHHAGVDELPVDDGSLDFGYSLGVLHHIPDTAAALRSCVRKLKPGAPFLVYLYYRFDDKPWWFKAIWRLSDGLRRLVSSLPHRARYAVSQVIALFVYWPLARLSLLAEKLGIDVSNFPLSFYRDKEFYVLRTDALDRFGTSLEQRFTRPEIERMMRDAGLKDIRFSDRMPKWCAAGTKA